MTFSSLFHVSVVAFAALVASIVTMASVQAPSAKKRRAPTQSEKEAAAKKLKDSLVANVAAKTNTPADDESKDDLQPKSIQECFSNPPSQQDTSADDNFSGIIEDENVVDFQMANGALERHIHDAAKPKRSKKPKEDKNLHSLLQRRIYDNFSKYLAYDLHVRRCDGLTLAETLLADLKLWVQDKLVMGAGYYRGIKKKFPRSDCDHSAIEPTDPDEEVSEEMITVLEEYEKSQKQQQQVIFFWNAWKHSTTLRPVV